jgi:nickel transport protein
MDFSDICIRAAMVCLLPAGVSGHELELTVTLSAPAALARAAYGGTDPVAFAKVQVLTPDGKEFQSGMTDRRGYFSFVPDVAGTWRLVVDDEEGHRGEMKVAVPDRFHDDQQAPVARSSRLERAALGLALIIGFTGFLYGFKARRRS